MSVRFKYQLVQGLDDKIGSDLRRIVEGYLGPDLSDLPALHRTAMSSIGRHGVWCLPSDYLMEARDQATAQFVIRFMSLYAPQAK
jgi:hypothetical protein